MYTYIDMRVCVCMYVCIYIYIYIDRYTLSGTRQLPRLVVVFQSFSRITYSN